MAETSVAETTLPGRKSSTSDSNVITIGEGKVHIGEKLGAGGYAQVNRALWETPDGYKVTVAAKRFSRPSRGDERTPLDVVNEDSQREALMTRLIAGPYALPILFHEMGSDGKPLLLMMLANGGTLTDRINKGMTPEGITQSVHEMALALAAAHEKGVVHRDVKPANFLVHNGRLYLADWGIAKFSGSPGVAVGEIVDGSPHFVAPERITGAEENPLADQYSAAVIAYYMYTGTLPFAHREGGGNLAILLGQVEETFPRFKKVIKDRALRWRLRHVESVIRKAASKNPKDRYPDMLAFAKALLKADAKGRKRLARFRRVDTPVDDLEAREVLLAETRAALEEEVTPELSSIPPIPEAISKKLRLGINGSREPQLEDSPVASETAVQSTVSHREKSQHRHMHRPHSVMLRHHKPEETVPAKFVGFFTDTLPKYFRASKHLRKR